MSKQANMAMVMQAFRNAGLSENQARILAAEVGRENAFQDHILWGYHADPKNGAKNIGMISWQGNRAKGVEAALKQAGLLQNGQIVRGQASLDVMARYLVDEIRNNSAYAETRRKFLENPDVDYQTGTKVLGTNFIRWRYNDPKYASGHRNRDRFYSELGGIAAQAPPAQPTVPPLTIPEFVPSAGQIPMPTVSAPQPAAPQDFLAAALSQLDRVRAEYAQDNAGFLL